jgi:uncharacterized protein YbjT (DUF2867 family)
MPDTSAIQLRTALVAGATGLIGKQVLDILVHDARYGHIIALSRSPLPSPHSRVTNLVTNFGSLPSVAAQLKADDIFCCLGTTMRQAGSQKAFREVDYNYPLALARYGKTNGAKQFLLVSALGANKRSRIFYNRVKGEVEEAIQQVGFETVRIFRPSLLLGPRAEKRSGEDSAKVLYKLLGWALPLRYKAIDSANVARAMIQLAVKDQRGFYVHESGELQKYSQ